MSPPLSPKALAIFNKVFWFCPNCATANNLEKTTCRTCKAPQRRKGE